MQVGGRLQGPRTVTENLPPAGKGAKMVVTWRGRCVGEGSLAELGPRVEGTLQGLEPGIKDPNLSLPSSRSPAGSPIV